jgi:hypothetical protein
MKKLLILVVVLALTLAALPFALAHGTPAVEVSDQVVVHGTIVISHVTSEGPGWLVVHNQTDGAPGPIVGVAPVMKGETDNLVVRVESWENFTPTMYAMLHVDDNEVGVYEFGSVDGADNPVSVDGNVVTPAFNVEAINAKPQFVDGTFTADVYTQQAGFLVIHQGVDASFGPVIGNAPLQAGANLGVTVTLEGEATPNLWPMIHVDTGEAGVYEFGSVEGVDGPVAINGAVATVSVPTYPSIIGHDQIIIHGDGMEMMMGDMGPVLYLHYVLAEVDGFVVAHNDNEGAPGPVAGVAPVKAGLNENVMIELDPAVMTPLMFPMLHVDDAAVGVYEFGTVEGADAPVSANGGVVVVPINIAPSFRNADPQSLGEGNTIVFSEVVIDAPGWMAIHSSVDGNAGPVIGTAKLNAGTNLNVVVSLDFAAVEGAATDQVFPMLHYDTGEMGTYEFDGANGLDLPVSVGGKIVARPLALQ